MGLSVYLTEVFNILEKSKMINPSIGSSISF